MQDARAREVRRLQSGKEDPGNAPPMRAQRAAFSSTPCDAEMLECLGSRAVTNLAS